MVNQPRGIWIWNLSEIRSDYLARLVERQVKRVYLKVFDGKFKGKLQPTFWDWQCSAEIVQEFQSQGIQVYGWGYHYGTADVDEQVAKVKQALACGLDGYILDVEEEVKNQTTHPNVEKLLATLRSLVKEGTLGYTSFGHPGFHPNVPWKMLDEYCDIALPQIYFEKFNFLLTTSEEVKACLDAHKRLGLNKPILPIWSSESDATKPATAAELQDYLSNFPGSSIWRIPDVGKRGEAWNLVYSDFELPTLSRFLRLGSKGEDVQALQKVLNARGFNAGTVDGDFGPKTEAAVIAFQTEANLTVDGVVGEQTWTALGGKFKAAQLVKFGDLSASEKQKVEAGFFFPPTFGNRYANPSNSNPKEWSGNAGQRARYIQDADMPVIADSGSRSADQIRAVINYFNVEDSGNKRFWPDGSVTCCNIFARDVMRCLRAPLTHWVGEKEQDANAMFDWLNNPANGWRKVTATAATEAASKGIPTLGCWKNPRGIGHIVVVRPEPGEPNNPRIAQAGAINFANGLATKGLSPAKGRFTYFVYG